MLDAVVVGGGPAGLVAATALARGGARVRLLERRGAAASQFKIGESLPGAAVRLMARLGLPPLEQGPHCPIPGATSLWAGNLDRRDFLGELDGPGWRLDRRRFEANLARVARDAGVEIAQVGLHTLRRKQSRWQIDVGKGEFTADFIVDASGRRRAVGRRVGTQTATSNGPPLVALWAVGKSSQEGQQRSTRTFTETTDQGWWYGAYLPEQRPVAIFHTSPEQARALQRAPRRFERALASTALISQQLCVPAFRGVSPQTVDASSSVAPQSCGEGWAACGDAALAFDPLASQGIFNALATADMLARAYLDGAFASYDDALRKIDTIYRGRRRAYYRRAYLHHRGPFWSRQLEAIPT